MQKRRRTAVILALTIAFISVAFSPNLRARQDSNGDGCKTYVDHSVPKFREGREYRVSGGALVIYLAIAPSDLDQETILALVCSVARKHSSEEALFVYVFDNYRAAKYFNPAGEGNTRETNLAFVARYGFFRDNKGGQGLSWRPDPKDFYRWTHINLGAPPERLPR